MQLTLDGTSLTLAALAPVLEGRPVELRVAKAALARVRAARKLVDDHVEAGNIVYGLTTGFGKLKSVAIAREDLAELQRNLVLSHSCGVGAPLSIPEARAAQILRLNGILRGHSGVRVEIVEQLVRLFNKGFVPVIPEKGSVGASGDLAPLAHMAAACMGVGEAWVIDASATSGARGASNAKPMKASAALRKIGEKPLELAAKEGLSLINGTEVMKAVGSGAALRAANLSKAADAIAALTIEALLGSARPFEQRFADLKGQPAHARCSDNVRRCLAGSQVLKSHANCARVQDAYSLRCTPQVHGASKAALEHVCAILAPELNSVTDNPVLFPDTGEVVSAGQFHGQPIAMALDYLAIGLTTLANISERRTEQLVNPDLSHLPAFLTPAPGLNSGFMIAQVTAAALCSENKGLAHPASADTIPTSANQEDHVSMGMGAARKAREIAANTEVVLAIELLCAAQAREFHRELRAGKGAEAAYSALREVAPALKKDRYLKKDIEAARELVASGAFVSAVEKATGPLLA